MLYDMVGASGYSRSAILKTPWSHENNVPEANKSHPGLHSSLISWLVLSLQQELRSIQLTKSQRKVREYEKG